MLLPLSECTRLTGKSRGALVKAIERGRLSAHKDPETGHWSVDASELSRVYRVLSGDTKTDTGLTPNDPGVRELTIRVQHLEDVLRRVEDERNYLREALQAEREVVYRLSLIETKTGQESDKVSPPVYRWWVVAALVGLVLAGALIWAVGVGRVGVATE